MHWHLRPVLDMDDQPGKPMGFTAAALFQWVNPKAWVISSFASDSQGPGALASVN